MGSGIRTPLVAGMFYPGDGQGLRDVLDEWRLGHEPDSDRSCSRPAGPLQRPIGVIVPHAGYMYSGRIAASGIRWLAEQGHPARIVILGADHTGMGMPVCTDGHDAWRTPLGDAPIDDEGRRLLVDAGIGIDGAAFVREHSIEVVLPLIQAAYGTATPFVPIRVGAAPAEVYTRLVNALVSMVGEDGAVVVSSDFTHYEPEQVARRVDRDVLKQICALDWRAVENRVVSERLSVCGVPAIIAALRWAGAIGMKRGDLLQYATSGDVTGDRSAVVGYAAVGLGWGKEKHGS